MTHNPKAVEVLAHELTADLDVPHGRDADWYSGRILDALTAADLVVVDADELARLRELDHALRPDLDSMDIAVVGEGQARIGGKVVRLEFAGCYDDPDDDRSGVRYEDERCSHDYDTTCTCQPLYVAIQDEGDEG